MALKCPNCHGSLNYVTNTYHMKEFKWRGKKYTNIKRRRVCEHCGTSWITVERNEEDILKTELATPPTAPAGTPTVQTSRPFTSLPEKPPPERELPNVKNPFL